MDAVVQHILRGPAVEAAPSRAVASEQRDGRSGDDERAVGPEVDHAYVHGDATDDRAHPALDADRDAVSERSGHALLGRRIRRHFDGHGWVGGVLVMWRPGPPELLSKYHEVGNCRLPVMHRAS